MILHLHERKNNTESKRGFDRSILPMLEKVNMLSTPGLSITLEDNILTVFDKQNYGRKFSIESGGIYTIRLGMFHDMDKGMLEESAMSCAIPIKAASEQPITAVFHIPEAMARFMDSVVLKATRPFTVALIEGSPILERHNRRWGIPLKYDHIETENMMILERTGLRKNVPNQCRAFFDVLSIQVEVAFHK